MLERTNKNDSEEFAGLREILMRLMDVEFEKKQEQKLLEIALKAGLNEATVRRIWQRAKYPDLTTEDGVKRLNRQINIEMDIENN